MENTTDPSLIPFFPSDAAQNQARAFAGATIALHAVAFIAFAGRMWSRSSPVFQMYLDDWICIVAYVSRDEPHGE
jgi:hypothetical protein